MADKQIIINGVDVSDCGYLGLYKECKVKSGSYCPVDCSDNPNCYYKQLIHKENECEKAKQNTQDTYDLWQALIKSFNILQGEKIKLEELKEQTDGLRPELKRLINEICHKYNIKAKTYHEKIVEIIHSLDDYKQALDDVEEILK